MDLDAILMWHPALALVDELAHTNAPGSRHPKRYQDVLELLDAGIDVFTTLNVQHVESRNDIVRQITGVTVRETVPDSMLDAADEIVLIDLTPEQLRARVSRKGKSIWRTRGRGRGQFFPREQSDGAAGNGAAAGCGTCRSRPARVSCKSSRSPGLGKVAIGFLWRCAAARLQKSLFATREGSRLRWKLPGSWRTSKLRALCGTTNRRD